MHLRFQPTSRARFFTVWKSNMNSCLDWCSSTKSSSVNRSSILPRLKTWRKIVTSTSNQLHNSSKTANDIGVFANARSYAKPRSRAEVNEAEMMSHWGPNSIRRVRRPNINGKRKRECLPAHGATTCRDYRTSCMRASWGSWRAVRRTGTLASMLFLCQRRHLRTGLDVRRCSWKGYLALTVKGFSICCHLFSRILCLPNFSLCSKEMVGLGSEIRRG